MSLFEQWLSPIYLDAKHIAKLQRDFLAAKPFSHIALQNLLRKEKCNALEAAVRKQSFSRKEADLFSFFQSPDLYDVRDKTIQEFLKLLQSSEFTKLMHSITGVKTKAGKVDASAFIYTGGDHLLCHDDGVSSRRIAYIYNLSTMRSKQGGALSLLSANAKDEPVRISKQIYPRKNTLVIFKVTKRSHHQVDEVIVGERITVTGWFHA